MSDAGWQVGDLALCLRNNWRRGHADHPKANEILTVKAVLNGRDTGGPTITLAFLERQPQSGYIGWSARFFRKIRPDEIASAQAAAANLFSKVAQELHRTPVLRDEKGKSA